MHVVSESACGRVSPLPWQLDYMKFVALLIEHISEHVSPRRSMVTWYWRRGKHDTYASTERLSSEFVFSRAFLGKIPAVRGITVNQP